MNIKDYIRDVPGFPKEGVIFKDITPLLLNVEALTETAEAMSRHFRPYGIKKVMGIEARGFIFAALVAERLKVGLIIVRKPGKLPYQTVSATYALEYGTDTLEMHKDAILPGEPILIVDDLLATGGTASACCDLVEKMKGKVAGCAFVIELSFLKGRKKLERCEVFSLIQYEKE